MSRIGLLTLIAALALLAGGCGTSDDRAQVRAVTARFYAAINGRDGAAACRQLSEAAREQLEGQSGQDCRQVVTRLDYAGGRVVRVAVFATNAKADLSGGESAFLSKEQEGWRLSAIACRPEQGKPRDRPMECDVAA